MGIRLTALYVFVTLLIIYAWKDWFISLCGLVIMMAVIEHEDMPKTMFGIQGLNMWNILFAGIFLAWLVTRRRENLKWDMPLHINILLLMYLVVIIIGFLRAVIDRSYIDDYPLKSLFSEELINTIKWVFPGLLLYDGCRTRKRLIIALVSLLGMYFLLAVQVVKRLPASSILQATGEIERTRMACSDIGYSAVDMSVFLAGAFWALISTLPMFQKKKHKTLILAAAGIVLFGQALTGGRAGYVAWAATGFTLCLFKWRKYLVFAPVVMILLPIVFPGAVDRMLHGFGKTDVSGQKVTDDYEVTSGRMLVWPHVIDKIYKSPFIGYGRLGMRRSGLTEYLRQEYGEADAFPHAHNMYLETLLDNGILGSIPILLFWAILVVYASQLFRSDNRLCAMVGGLALSLMLTQLVAGLGSQHFYPEESMLGMWAAMFLALRVYLEQKRMQMSMIANEDSWNRRLMQQQLEAASVYTYGTAAR
jgi:O-antigen ligase